MNATTARRLVRRAPHLSLGACATVACAAFAIAGCYIDDPLVYDDTTDAGPGGGGAGTGGAAGGAAGGATGGDAGTGAQGGAPPCTSDLGCDDANPCTTDRCAAAGCEHDPVAQGTSCGSTDVCAGTETCDGQGACVKGAPKAIDDGDVCTTDACDPSNGAVTHALTAGCATPTSMTGAPAPRKLHTAVWTGSEMIVWGGSGTGSPASLATGARFDPIANAWTPTSTTGAPPPRHTHCAAWTGSRMIVWGGYGTSSFESTGGVYDPATDTWTAMATTGAPSGRVLMSCAWTGTELVVWGGTTGGVLGNGGRYDPATNTWKPLPASGAPTPRYGHTAVWTGTRAIIWGGNDLFDWHRDGTPYDPAGNAWTGIIQLTGAPSAREQHSALWTGSRMVVWGGFTGGVYENTGGAFDPAGNAWTALATTGAPSRRTEHAAVWTGSQMIVWGGCGMDSCKELYNDGGTWTPDTGGGTWAAIAASPNVAARRGATGVWTGRETVIWGGRTSTGETDTGAILHP